MDEPTDNVTRLTTIAKMMEDGNWYSSAKVMVAAAAEIEQLRKERNEARREVCKNVVAISASMNAKQWARERGWDCFEKDGNA